MKRIVSLALAVLLVTALFSGCSLFESAPSVEGVYVLKTVDGMDVATYLAKAMNRPSLSGAEINQALYQLGITSFDEILTIELRADHTCTGTGIIETGAKQTKNGKWTQSGNKVDFGKGEATFKDGELTFELKGMKIVLIRK
ncbi:MAG: hypothetical protein J5789_00395 [Oscillospiraceae bacterium]|nr:hypothetical protein [Oscillospiraceae bacterium]